MSTSQDETPSQELMASSAELEHAPTSKESEEASGRIAKSKRKSRRKVLREGLGVTVAGAAVATVGAGGLLEMSTGSAHADGNEGPTTFTGSGQITVVTVTGTNGADGIYATSDGAFAIGGHSASSLGLYGTSGTNLGISGYCAGNESGVQGISEHGPGVAGFCKSNDNFGVVGRGQNAGVAAFNPNNDHAAYLASACCAAWFTGDVHITGTLSKGGGSFQIDHPLNPAEKYLYHSFVESPDMKNIYDGVVTLDSHGEAVVELPSWFEALNTDFRYQLTCIGGYAPVYIAQEVEGSHFKIAGGKPAMKVCWQVTGIRQDAWAKANRIPVEETKAAEERGRYLYPELYGAPKEKRIVPVHSPEWKPLTPLGKKLGTDSH
jgi:hypothetical protein